MRVAVLGGGLQGCSVAIALAQKGVEVALFDRNADLLTRAASANEGKIHLGYMYAGDPTLRTAGLMMQGALSFAPFLSDHLGIAPHTFAISAPAVYVTHRESQKSPEGVSGYMHAVHKLVQNAIQTVGGSYFGLDLRRPLRNWSAAEIDQEFNSHEIHAAITSPEVAIDPVALAVLVGSCVKQTRKIELFLEHDVTSVHRGAHMEVVSTAFGQRRRHRFDHVVNALWDGRLAIDSELGLLPTWGWIHRLKYGISFKPPPDAPLTRSITVVLGPFGEVVSYANGTVYLTWYPDCLKASTTAVRPPLWRTSPEEPLRSEIMHGTLLALSNIMPALRRCNVERISDVRVRGGPIVARGQTDIDDPDSELHHRFEIGVSSFGNYHSIDPGKLTMAPFFAAECARRILG